MDFNSSKESLSLPPFGRILQAYIEEKVKLSVPIWLYVGKDAKDIAFAEKRTGNLCTFLPFKDDVARYRWPVENQKIVIEDTGGMSHVELKRICYVLLKYKPRIIYLYSEKNSSQLILPPGRSHHDN